MLFRSYSQILNKDEVVVIEKKTKKTREIKINHQLKKHISACCEKLNHHNFDDFIFKSLYTVTPIFHLNRYVKLIKLYNNIVKV